MSGDIHAYRASDELAAALRVHGAADAAFRDRVHEWDLRHPGHESRWAASPFDSDQLFAGFFDGTADVPPGLSRAKSRMTLAPARGLDGAPWREAAAWMRKRPQIGTTLRPLGVPTGCEGPGRRDGSFIVAPTRWFDAGADGVLVHCQRDLSRTRHGDGTLSPHLTPMLLSEFYAIRERLDAEREQAKAAAS